MGSLCIRFLLYQFLCLWHLMGWLVLAVLCLAGCYQSSLRLPGLHRREWPGLRLQLRLPRPAVPISSALNTVCLLGGRMRCSLPGLPAGRILRLRFRLYSRRLTAHLYFRRLAVLHFRLRDSPGCHPPAAPDYHLLTVLRFLPGLCQALAFRPVPVILLRLCQSGLRIPGFLHFRNSPDCFLSGCLFPDSYCPERSILY